MEKRPAEWQGEGEHKVMLATGTERLYNLITVGWRGVCPSVILERNSMFETGRSVVTFPPTNTLYRSQLLNISDRSERRTVELCW